LAFKLTGTGIDRFAAELTEENLTRDLENFVFLFGKILRF
jgi:hypothetical protein